MPVKNVKRKTNDGFEGVITGLNDKEKEIISNSVGIEANPVDEATDTLTKLKVGDTTYDFNRTLIKNGTYVSEEGFATLNSFSFTAEEMEKINNGEIDMLIGEFNKRSETYYYNAKKYYLGDDDMPLFICSSYTLMNGKSIHYDEVQIYPSLSQGGMISADSPFIPELPSDASTKKYTLKAVNETLTWVDLATDTETFNNVIANSNVTAQGNISAVGKISTVGGLEVYGNSVFTKNLSTSATLKGAHVVAGDTELLPVTPNPTDEATETLEKLKIGDIAYNVGGGASYTAGKNISISETNEISIANDMESVNSIKFNCSEVNRIVTIKQSSSWQTFAITTDDLNYFPSIQLFAGNNYSYKNMYIYVDGSNFNLNNMYRIHFEIPPHGYSVYDFYTLVTRGKVPDVPSSDGTYVLKATVSSGTLTYSWVKEGE